MVLDPDNCSATCCIVFDVFSGSSDYSRDINKICWHNDMLFCSIKELRF